MNASERTTMPSGVRGANLAARFLLELAMLVALAVSGARLGSSTALSIVLAVALPAAAAALWGAFVAPKARRPLPVAARVAVELTLFATTAVLLAAAGLAVAAAVFAVAVAVNEVLLSVWRQR